MAIDPIPFAEGYATPAQVQSARETAKWLLGKSQEPVKHWTMGMANIANALVGGLERRRANELESQALAGVSKRMLDTGYSKKPEGGEVTMPPASTQTLPSTPALPSEKAPKAKGIKTDAPDKGVQVASLDALPSPDTSPAEAAPLAFAGDTSITSPTVVAQALHREAAARGSRAADNPALGGAGKVSPELSGPPVTPGFATAIPGGGTAVDPRVTAGRIRMDRDALQDLLRNPYAPEGIKTALYAKYLNQDQPITIPQGEFGDWVVGPNGPPVWSPKPMKEVRKYGEGVEEERWFNMHPTTNPDGTRGWKKIYVEDSDTLGPPSEKLAPPTEGAPPIKGPGIGSGGGSAPVPASPIDTLDDDNLSIKPPKKIGAEGAPNLADTGEEPELGVGGAKSPLGVQVASAGGNEELAGLLAPKNVPEPNYPSDVQPTVKSEEPTQRFAGSFEERLKNIQDWRLRRDRERISNEKNADELRKFATSAKDAGYRAVGFDQSLALAENIVDDPNFITGSFADERQSLAKLGAFLAETETGKMLREKGITLNDFLNPSGGTPNDVFNKTIQAALMEQLKTAFGGLGQIRVAEIEMLQRASANQNNTREANREILRMMRHAAKDAARVGKITNAYMQGVRWDDDGNPIRGADGKLVRHTNLIPNKDELDGILSIYQKEHPLFNKEQMDFLRDTKGRSLSSGERMNPGAAPQPKSTPATKENWVPIDTPLPKGAKRIS